MLSPAFGERLRLLRILCSVARVGVHKQAASAAALLLVRVTRARARRALGLRAAQSLGRGRGCPERVRPEVTEAFKAQGGMLRSFFQE